MPAYIGTEMSIHSVAMFASLASSPSLEDVLSLLQQICRLAAHDATWLECAPWSQILFLGPRRKHCQSRQHAAVPAVITEAYASAPLRVLPSNDVMRWRDLARYWDNPSAEGGGILLVAQSQCREIRRFPDANPARNGVRADQAGHGLTSNVRWQK